MSRLINFGAGDISDRLTVLNLKILYGSEAGRDTAHWQNERNALLTQVRSRTITGQWLEPFLELGAVNAAIWHATDELRKARENREEAGRIGLRIMDLNDKRAALVDDINKLAGDHIGEDKVEARR